MSNRQLLNGVAAISVAIGMAATGGLGLEARTAPQFANVPVPAEIEHLQFLVGTWTVENRYRTPDHIGTDRSLWYRTSTGVSRFDGRAWQHWTPGESADADAVLAKIREVPAEPAVYTYARTVTRVQDGFALVVEDGRTGGTALVSWDAAKAQYLWRLLHAATGGFSESPGKLVDGALSFTGAGNGPRGPQISKTRYEIVDEDHYKVHTDVSFDEGATWIVDQSLQDVRRVS